MQKFPCKKIGVKKSKHFGVKNFKKWCKTMGVKNNNYLRKKNYFLCSDGPEIEMLLTTKSVSSVEEYRESLANERQKKWDELKFRQKIEESEKHQHRSK